MRLHQFVYRDTGYPLEIEGTFASSDPTLEPLWNISINTLLRCMHETYADCPYYEQMQYTMDTRLQMLFNYGISSDDRLGRKAIHEFHASLLPSGMLQCRYPSVHPQVIPGFALYWVSMVHDHYMHYGDLTLVKRYRPTIDAVLDWFDRMVTEQGLVGKMPAGYWSFVDWVKEWRVNAGVPPGYEQGPITIYSLMYSNALQMAAHLNASSGRPDTASEYEARAQRVNEAVQQCCWSDKRKLFKDGPAVEGYSQHVQIWAVLAGLVKGDDAAALMDATLTDKTLYQVSYAMSYFLFRALSQTGMYDRSFNLWDTWRRLVDLHLTTWVEDPVMQRSDCHAWGAVPLSEFPSEVLGVKPGEPGYAKIHVAPQPGHLQWAKGTVPTVQGPVNISWSLNDGVFNLSVQGPKGVPVDLYMPDGTVSHYPDASQISSQCTISSYSNNR